MSTENKKTTEQKPNVNPKKLTEGVWGGNKGTTQIVRRHSSTSGKGSRITQQRMNFFGKPR